MKIIQVLPTISFGDAVGNDTLAIKDILEKNGYKTAIYAENIDKRLPKGTAQRIEQLNGLSLDDVIIYHLSTGTALNTWIKQVPCKKICIYHNITPPDFFEPYSLELMNLCSCGLQEVQSLRDTFDCVWADSEFNKLDLINMGYTCQIKVLPILIPFDDYKKQPNKLTLKKYDDDYVNLLFVGRVAPNKKQEDIITTFHYYNKYYNNKSRLFLVGSYNGLESYYVRLKEYVDRLDTPNVYFTGQIKFDEILAYYKLSDAFICMSEHEGFCVPLVEAMCFGKPIVAYDSSAIKDTLGGSGFVIEEKNPIEIAGVINQIIENKELYDRICHNEALRLNDFDNIKIEKKLIEYLEEFINQK